MHTLKKNWIIGVKTIINSSETRTKSHHRTKQNGVDSAEKKTEKSDENNYQISETRTKSHRQTKQRGVNSAQK